MSQEATCSFAEYLAVLERARLPDEHREILKLIAYQELIHAVQRHEHTLIQLENVRITYHPSRYHILLSSSNGLYLHSTHPITLGKIEPELDDLPTPSTRRASVDTLASCDSPKASHLINNYQLLRSCLPQEILNSTETLGDVSAARDQLDVLASTCRNAINELLEKQAKALNTEVAGCWLERRKNTKKLKLLLLIGIIASPDISVQYCVHILRCLAALSSQMPPSTYRTTRNELFLNFLRESARVIYYTYANTTFTPEQMTDRLLDGRTARYLGFFDISAAAIRDELTRSDDQQPKPPSRYAAELGSAATS